MNLFNLTTEYRKLAHELIECEGELSQDTELALAINFEQLEQKGISYGYVIKEMESEVDTIDEEIKRLTQLKKVRNNAVERLKSTLSQAMELYSVTELKTPTIKINFRKSESIEILDETKVSELFKDTKIVTTISKTKIKEAIKEGAIVDGAVLSINYNLQIK